MPIDIRIRIDLTPGQKRIMRAAVVAGTTIAALGIGVALAGPSIDTSWIANGAQLSATQLGNDLNGLQAQINFPVAQQVFTTGTGTYSPSYVFVVVAASATAGATYTNSGHTFTVSQTISGQGYLVTTGPDAPAASGTLTRTSGTGDATITFVVADNTPRYLEVTLIGGGAGGGSSCQPGYEGSPTTFGTSLLTANGAPAGGGCAATSPGATASSLAGTATGISLPGALGSSGAVTGTGSNQANGGTGGASPLGGPGVGGNANTISSATSAAGGAALANTGSGGGGAGSDTDTSWTGSGGGAGGFVKALINSPAASYAYAVGTGGEGGGTGEGPTLAFLGGAGASGIVIVEEHY